MGVLASFSSCNQSGCYILCHGDLIVQLLLFINYVFWMIFVTISTGFCMECICRHFFCRTESMSNIMQTCSTNNKECDRLTAGSSGGGLLPRSSAPLLTERLLIMLPQACCDWMLPSKPTCQCETGSP